MARYGVCPECQGELINKGGCQECPHCFWSACGRSSLWSLAEARESFFILPIILAMVFFSFLFTGCRAQYKDDVPTMTSLEAASPEFPVVVKSKVCRDSMGETGLCSVRHPRNLDLEIEVTPLQYNFNLEFDCSSNVQQSTQNFTYKALEEVKPLVVSRNEFDVEDITFVCTVKILPLDRSFPAVSFARVYVQLIDERYKPLPSPTMAQGGFFFGENAKYIEYEKDGKTFFLKETTYTKVSGISRIFIESNSGRRVSWYGY